MVCGFLSDVYCFCLGFQVEFNLYTQNEDKYLKIVLINYCVKFLLIKNATKICWSPNYQSHKSYVHKCVVHSTIGVDRPAIPFQHFNIFNGIEHSFITFIQVMHMQRECIRFRLILISLQTEYAAHPCNAAFGRKIITIPFELVHIGNVDGGEKPFQKRREMQYNFTNFASIHISKICFCFCFFVVVLRFFELTSSESVITLSVIVHRIIIFSETKYCSNMNHAPTVL